MAKRKNSWRNTSQYRVWKREVFKRCGIKCVICGSRKRLHSHHINHASYFKDQRFDPMNGVTMCRSCHTNFHTNFKRSYREKCTLYDLLNFHSLMMDMIPKFGGSVEPLIGLKDLVRDTKSN